MRTVTKGTLVLAAILTWGLALSATPALAAKADKIDINSASQSELESLPGVGAATAKKIIAGRPFSSVSDLSRVGLSADTIAKIKPLVKAGRGSAAAAETAKTEKSTAKAAKEEKATAAAKETRGAPASPSGARLDLNTASEKDLEALPAVGAATAKKIIAGRPYSSVADLSKAGVPAKTIEKISPLVTVSAKAAAPSSAVAAPAASASTSGSAAATSKPASSSSSSSSAAASAPAQAPPVKGMVWVNTETKVFHREGDKWYGNTKHGKYMTEADALKAGYRESKEHQKKS